MSIFDTCILGFFVWVFAQFLSRMISPMICKSYKDLSESTKVEWDVKVVSQIFVLSILPMVYYARQDQSYHSNETEMLYTTTAFTEKIFGIAVSYFVWDLCMCMLFFDIYGFTFSIHSSCCVIVYIVASQPFAPYYALTFLFFELSTIFLNIHWFLDKTKQTGSLTQLVNGVILLTTFFSARILYGFYISFYLLSDLHDQRLKINTFLLSVTVFLIFTLNSLNVFWFRKMILSASKRLPEYNKG